MPPPLGNNAVGQQAAGKSPTPARSTPRRSFLLRREIQERESRLASALQPVTPTVRDRDRSTSIKGRSASLVSAAVEDRTQGLKHTTIMETHLPEHHAHLAGSAARVPTSYNEPALGPSIPVIKIDDTETLSRSRVNAGLLSLGEDILRYNASIGLSVVPVHVRFTERLDANYLARVGNAHLPQLGGSTFVPVVEPQSEPRGWTAVNRPPKTSAGGFENDINVLAARVATGGHSREPLLELQNPLKVEESFNVDQLSYREVKMDRENELDLDRSGQGDDNPMEQGSNNTYTPEQHDLGVHKSNDNVLQWKEEDLHDQEPGQDNYLDMGEEELNGSNETGPSTALQLEQENKLDVHGSAKEDDLNEEESDGKNGSPEHDLEPPSSPRDVNRPRTQILISPSPEPHQRRPGAYTSEEMQWLLDHHPVGDWETLAEQFRDRFRYSRTVGGLKGKCSQLIKKYVVHSSDDDEAVELAFIKDLQIRQDLRDDSKPDYNHMRAKRKNRGSSESDQGEAPKKLLRSAGLNPAKQGAWRRRLPPSPSRRVQNMQATPDEDDDSDGSSESDTPEPVNRKLLTLEEQAWLEHHVPEFRLENGKLDMKTLVDLFTLQFGLGRRKDALTRAARARLETGTPDSDEQDGSDGEMASERECDGSDEDEDEDDGSDEDDQASTEDDEGSDEN